MFYSIFLDLRQLIRQKGTDEMSSMPFAKLYLHYIYLYIIGIGTFLFNRNLL